MKERRSHYFQFGSRRNVLRNAQFRVRNGRRSNNHADLCTMNGSIIDKLPHYGILSESFTSLQTKTHCIDNANSYRDTDTIFGTLHASRANTTLFYLFAVFH